MTSRDHRYSRVFIKSPTDGAADICNVVLENGTTVTLSSLKSRLELKLGLPADAFDVFHGRTQLSDVRPLYSDQLRGHLLTTRHHRQSWTLLTDSVYHGNLSTVLQLCRVSDANESNAASVLDQLSGFIALCLASRSGNTDIVNALCRLDYDGSIRKVATPFGRTPLHIACANDHDRVVNLLLAFHYNPLAKDVAQQTPITVAQHFHSHSAATAIWTYLAGNRKQKYDDRRVMAMDDSLPDKSWTVCPSIFNTLDATDNGDNRVDCLTRPGNTFSGFSPTVCDQYGFRDLKGMHVRNTARRRQTVLDKFGRETTRAQLRPEVNYTVSGLTQNVDVKYSSRAQNDLPAVSSAYHRVVRDVGDTTEQSQWKPETDDGHDANRKQLCESTVNKPRRNLYRSSYHRALLLRRQRAGELADPSHKPEQATIRYRPWKTWLTELYASQTQKSTSGLTDEQRRCRQTDDEASRKWKRDVTLRRRQRHLVESTEDEVPRGRALAEEAHRIWLVEKSAVSRKVNLHPHHPQSVFVICCSDSSTTETGPHTDRSRDFIYSQSAWRQIQQQRYHDDRGRQDNVATLRRKMLLEGMTFDDWIYLKQVERSTSST